MKKLWFIVGAAIVAGCVVTPKFEDNALKQVRASIAQDEGAVKFASVAIWLPNSREFKFSEVQPTIKGVAVITQKSFLFQQWGGSAGLTTIKRIPLAEIHDASIITFGMSGRLVIRTDGDKYDSFAASDGAGEISVRAETTEMYNILSAMLVKIRR